MQAFNLDTAVHARGTGRYSATLAGRWSIPDGPSNGGYLMAIAARAMSDHVDRPHPVSLTCHFVNPGHPGAAEVEVETVRPGGRHATAAARLVQDGTEVVRLLGTFADLTGAAGPTIVNGAPPDLPPLDACSASPPSDDEIIGRFDYRLPPEDLGWRHGAPKGEGRMTAYVGFHGGGAVDAFGLVSIVDAFAPVVFDLGLGPGWAPTIELTVHVRRLPVPGRLRAALTTRFVTDGYHEEDVELWDADGHLVAQARQLALAPRS